MDIKEKYKFFDQKTGSQANVNVVPAQKLIVIKKTKVIKNWQLKKNQKKKVYSRLKDNI